MVSGKNLLTLIHKKGTSRPQSVKECSYSVKHCHWSKRANSGSVDCRRSGSLVANTKKGGRLEAFPLFPFIEFKLTATEGWQPWLCRLHRSGSRRFGR